MITIEDITTNNSGYVKHDLPELVLPGRQGHLGKV